MRRFAVFKSPYYYPYGGMGDFVKSFDTKEEADAFAEGLTERSHNVDVNDMEEYE